MRVLGLSESQWVEHSFKGWREENEYSGGVIIVMEWGNSRSVVYDVPMSARDYYYYDYKIGDQAYCWSGEFSMVKKSLPEISDRVISELIILGVSRHEIEKLREHKP